MKAPRKHTLVLFAVASLVGGCRQGPTAEPGPSEAVTTPGAGQPSASGGPPTPTLASVAAATARIEALLPEFVRSIGQPGIEPGQLTLPFDVAVTPEGAIWVSDSTGVQKLDAEGRFTLKLDSKELPVARGLALGPDGTLYVAGYGPQIHAYADDGTSKGLLGQAGSGVGQLAEPVDVAVDAKGRIVVADRRNRRIEVLDTSGRSVLTIGAPGAEDPQFTMPWSVAVDAQGRIYVGSADHYLIQRFGADGHRIDAFGESSSTDVVWQTAGLTFGADGTLYALQTPKQLLQAYDVDADPPRLKWQFGALGLGDREFNSPSGLAVQAGLVYLADTDNHRIEVFRPKAPG